VLPLTIIWLCRLPRFLSSAPALILDQTGITHCQLLHGISVPWEDVLEISVDSLELPRNKLTLELPYNKSPHILRFYFRDPEKIHSQVPFLCRWGSKPPPSSGDFQVVFASFKETISDAKPFLLQLRKDQPDIGFLLPDERGDKHIPW